MFLFYIFYFIQVDAILALIIHTSITSIFYFSLFSYIISLTRWYIIISYLYIFYIISISGTVLQWYQYLYFYEVDAMLIGIIHAKWILYSHFFKFLLNFWFFTYITYLYLTRWLYFFLFSTYYTYKKIYIYMRYAIFIFMRLTLY